MLAIRTGVEVAAIESMMLSSRGSSEMPLDLWLASLMPISLGAHKRKPFGLQGCLECFRQPTPYFRRIWRSALVTVCSNHRKRLVDSCPVCNKPFSSTALYARPNRVSACTLGCDVTSSTFNPEVASDTLLTLQREILEGVGSTHMRRLLLSKHKVRRSLIPFNLLRISERIVLLENNLEVLMNYER
jgi:hypothetical protein